MGYSVARPCFYAARGTRILPDAIVNSYDAGETLDLIHDYPGLSIPQIQRVVEFAHGQVP